jgi:hypothetical protein
MPDYRQLMNELRSVGSTCDAVRRKYLARLHRVTGRNVIIYYSGWASRSGQSNPIDPCFELSEGDRSGFMAAVEKLDPANGLDLILHTPGGCLGATESLVEFLRSVFGGNIRAVIPQIVVSTGTMLALACNEVVMGKPSGLGAIDVRIDGRSAYAVVEEFDRAALEIHEDPPKAGLWQPILAHYRPTFVGAARKALNSCEKLSREWWMTGVFAGLADGKLQANRTVVALGKNMLAKSEAGRLGFEEAKKLLGKKLTALEDDEKLNDAVLSVHHACIQTLLATNTAKIIENHRGASFVLSDRQIKE